MSWWREGAQEPAWQTIVPEPAPLAELVIEGNGKDLDLEVALTGGRRLQMGAADVAVSTDGHVEMQLERLDDLNLKIRYAGPGLEIRSMQVRFPDPGWQEEFIARTRAFLAGDVDDEDEDEDEDDLGYCVDAKIVLAAIPGPSASDGDPQ